jgi:hypothetical protein
MDLANSHIPKVKSTMETGTMTRLMATDCMFTRTGQGTRVNGREISSMARGLRAGLIHQNSQENTKKVERMGWESMCGLTEPSTKDSGKRMKLRVMVTTNGVMAGST